MLAARGAGLGTWDVDLRDGEVEWDEQMWRLRGRAPQARPPSSEEALAIVHPDDRPLARRHMESSFGARGHAEHRVRVLWPDGSVHWLASRSAAVTDAHGRPVRRIGVNWDITAARRADDEHREFELAVRASQAKSQFLARVSHELRTPLNAVLGFAQLLLIEEADGSPRRARLQHIEDAGRHLLALIDDVLDIASIDTGELRFAREPVPLASLLRATLPLVEAQRQARAVELRTQVGEHVVLADPTRVRQVLLNLVSNAVKYNRDGGRVWVDAAADGDQVRITVRDEGRGMSATQLRQLFEPFNRLGVEREPIEGTGIGPA
jgi:signal transduction histidine kinase